jgi:hypothetical protein
VQRFDVAEVRVTKGGGGDNNRDRNLLLQKEYPKKRFHLEFIMDLLLSFTYL